MARLKKEEIEMAPNAVTLKSEADAAVVWTTVQQLLYKIHLT